jgi:RNA 3'-terminal phosphate cyclase (ATP)
LLFEVDGSQKSGSGTILRLAVALSAIQKEPLHITNIRQNRPQPGLKPQHLEAVLTAARLCNAKLQGALLGSRELTFMPNEVSGGDLQAEIGTAGSIPMLLMTVLPICLHAEKPVHLHVCKGGTDTIHAPTINYLKHVFLPVLRRMGVEADIEVQKYGYYPKGMGEVTLTVKPQPNLQPFRIESFGKLQGISGVSVCTFLADRKVAERQAEAAKKALTAKGFESSIRVVNDMSNPLQKGSSLVLWAQTDTGARLGADAIGELKKSSEVVGAEAAENLNEELSTQPTVDVHLADMLIPYIALAKGESVYTTRNLSEHIEANIWLTQKIFNTKFTTKKTGTTYKVTKVA